jgi:hypothetical protein
LLGSENGLVVTIERICYVFTSFYGELFVNFTTFFFIELILKLLILLLINKLVIKKEQSRDTSNMGHKTLDGDKQDKNTTTKTNDQQNEPPTKKMRVKPGAREE